MKSHFEFVHHNNFSLIGFGLRFKSSSANINDDDYDILLCEDEVDNKARICCAKVGIHPRSSHMSSWKKKEVECYYKYRESY
ncbi:hypothetical protein TSUD_329420 [Trifolium subterraneum]|uniref:Uncharacterized protein n=1 Tax=Trifolium subterraneum TaxID=3900 RepID=A0A2Z6NEP2_TRISU|nr:hypothetical protein TSUD_329420 [Trifolium subterraneum]